MQAHLTAIEGKSRRSDPALYDLKLRVTSILKKWITAANANLTTRSIPLHRLRAISMSQRFETGSDLAGRQSGGLPPGGPSRCDKHKVDASDAGQLPSSAAPMPPSPSAKPKKNPDAGPILPDPASAVKP